MNGVYQASARFGSYSAQPAQYDAGKTVSPVLDLSALYQDGSGGREKDFYRDTGARYLGYANDIGEAFRSVIGPTWAHRTYWVAGAYALADALSKGKKSFNEARGESFHDRMFHFLGGVLDVGIFHFIASITVPPMIIRATQDKINKVMSRRMAQTAFGRGLPVAVGLALIPLIVKPVDWAAEKFLDMTIRPVLGRPKYFHDSHKHESGHHRRVDEASRRGPLVNGHPIKRSTFFDSTFA